MKYLIVPLAFFSCFLLVGLVGAQIVVPGCPRFSAMPNVDLTKMMGTWFIHGWVQNSEFNLAFRCLHVHWTLNQTNGLMVDEIVHLTSTNTNITATETHTALIQNQYRPTKWFINERNTDYDVNIIYTNYEYSMWTQCSRNVAEDKIFIQVFMASRYEDEEFPADLRLKFEALMLGDYDANYVNNFYQTVPQGTELCKE